MCRWLVNMCRWRENCVTQEMENFVYWEPYTLESARFISSLFVDTVYWSVLKAAVLQLHMTRTAKLFYSKLVILSGKAVDLTQ